MRHHQKTSTVVAVGWAAAALMLGGCGPSSSGSSAPPASGKYEQTWTMSYGETTCGHFLTEMTDKQRWVMAADMLVGARKRDGGGEGGDVALREEFVVVHQVRAW
jgi:hypothetical protein